MARKKRKTIIPGTLLLICIITGIATLVLRMLNRKMQVSELGEIAGYAGTVFAISLVVIASIFIINRVAKK